MENKLLKELYDYFYVRPELDEQENEVEECHKALIAALEKPERKLVLRIIDAQAFKHQYRYHIQHHKGKSHSKVDGGYPGNRITTISTHTYLTFISAVHRPSLIPEYHRLSYLDVQKRAHSVLYHSGPSSAHTCSRDYCYVLRW